MLKMVCATREYLPIGDRYHHLQIYNSRYNMLLEVRSRRPIDFNTPVNFQVSPRASISRHLIPLSLLEPHSFGGETYSNSK